ncbi:hypothetical protein OESDEN_15293 [Oesophagostomum dentatum]|uniref:Protein kinase domain-containing protein n=1 Tax=Oesophagostomum dentatum TaxID=61180 RepID=A0A0B1SN88_OESDE|nr:hypothetical protein OESDEN_15293 [Oesophagostomum dentatum]
MYTYFWDEKRIYLVLEYAKGGEMYKLLKKRSRFSETTAAVFMYQMADALNYCHEKNVIHRDIKPENLLIGDEGQLKIADFGWSVRFQFPPYVSSGARDLINKLLQRDPKKRLSLKEVMEHEWVQYHLRKRESTTASSKRSCRDDTI